MLQKSVNARFVRIFPQEWTSTSMCMRFDLLGCYRENGKQRHLLLLFEMDISLSFPGSTVQSPLKMCPFLGQVSQKKKLSVVLSLNGSRAYFA